MKCPHAIDTHEHTELRSFCCFQGSGRGGRTMPVVAPPPGGYRLLVLVGIPGSGKSTFASFLTGMGW